MVEVSYKIHFYLRCNYIACNGEFYVDLDCSSLIGLSMVEKLKQRLGLVRVAVYVIVVTLLFINPINPVRFLIILILLLLLTFLYKRCNYYNVNYEIPDMLCILYLINQIGLVVWKSIS